MKKGKKRSGSTGALLLALIWTLAAVLWWINAFRDLGIAWLTALVWTLGAAIFWLRYFKTRKIEQNSDITGGNENE